METVVYLEALVDKGQHNVRYDVCHVSHCRAGNPHHRPILHVTHSSNNVSWSDVAMGLKPFVFVTLWDE